jgi:hypothetical protein
LSRKESTEDDFVFDCEKTAGQIEMQNNKESTEKDQSRNVGIQIFFIVRKILFMMLGDVF